MQHAECANRQSVAQHATEGSIAAVFSRAQPVAVFHACAPAAEISRPRTELKVDAGVPEHVDTLVLGCTHYPLLKPVIGEIVGRSVRLIDSAEETALDARRMLAENDLAATDGEAEYRFIASDDPQQFLTLGRRFLGSAIERVEVRTFG